MTDLHETGQPVLMRSSLKLDEGDDLFGLITTAIEVAPTGGIVVSAAPTTHRTKKTKIVLLQARIPAEAPPAILTILQDLVIGVFPASAIEKLKAKTPPGAGSRVPSMSMYEMPAPFQTFCWDVRVVLHRAISELVGILRWRLGLPRERPLYGYGDAFSLDGGETWHGLPHDIKLNLSVEVLPKSLTATHMADAKKLIADGKEEPIGRALIREAWSLRSGSPRAALTVGYAALEVGTKELIGKLVPTAKWLAMETPSPPLDKVLKKFIPQLPKKCDFPKKGSLPPVLLKSVGEAMQARNELAHKGEFSWDSGKLEVVLRAFDDLLWIFDVYAGEQWAEARLSSETRAFLASAG